MASFQTETNLLKQQKYSLSHNQDIVYSVVMCVNVSVHAYVRVCVWIHIYLHIYTYVCIYVCIVLLRAYSTFPTTDLVPYKSNMFLPPKILHNTYLETHGIVGNVPCSSDKNIQTLSFQPQNILLVRY